MRAVTIVLLAALAACSVTREVPPPPKNVYEQAAISGYEDIRHFGDVAPESVDDLFGEIVEQVARRAAAEGAPPNGGRFDVLVLSGGGSDGPYGAGLLKAWSERGDRPEFGIVTGVSVGALIAPFAFLGPDYDPALERALTGAVIEEVGGTNFLAALVNRALGLNDPGPIERLLERRIDAGLIRRIGEQHALGRRLYVGTTNLDAQRPMIWDIGRIAASGRPDALGLIRRILLASASIPGAFPPVMIPVTVGGQTWEEMHVDGGVTNQLFFYPYAVDLPDGIGDRLSPAGPGTVYVIRNTKIDPAYEAVEAGVLPVSERALQTLIKSSSRNDVRQLAEQAEREGFFMKLAAVPEEFDIVPEWAFDPDYMNALFALGYRAMREGDPWRVVVPKLDEELTIAGNES